MATIKDAIASASVKFARETLEDTHFMGSEMLSTVEREMCRRCLMAGFAAGGRLAINILERTLASIAAGAEKAAKP